MVNLKTEISERYVSRLLKKLGFANRRVGDGTEYFLTVAGVEKLAQRKGIKKDGEVSEDSVDAGGQGTQIISECVIEEAKKID